MSRENKKSHDQEIGKGIVVEEEKGSHLKEKNDAGHQEQESGTSDHEEEKIGGNDSEKHTDEEQNMSSADKQNENDDVEEKKLSPREQKKEDKRRKKEKRKGSERRSKKSVAISIGLVSVIGVGLITGAVIIKGGDSGSLIDFNTGSDDAGGQSAESMRLKLEIDDINQKLSSLESLPTEVKALEAEKENMNDKIENLRESLEQEVRIFFEKSKQREKESLALRRELDDLVDVGEKDREKLNQIGSRLAELHKESEKEALEMEAKLNELGEAIKSEQPEEDRVESGTNKQVKERRTTVKEIIDNEGTKQVRSLGHLTLESVRAIGSHKIALLTDGISGAVQVSEGDNIGVFRVTSIHNDHLIAVHQNGAKFRLVIGGDA